MSARLFYYDFAANNKSSCFSYASASLLSPSRSSTPDTKLLFYAAGTIVGVLFSRYRGCVYLIFLSLIVTGVAALLIIAASYILSFSSDSVFLREESSYWRSCCSWLLFRSVRWVNFCSLLSTLQMSDFILSLLFSRFYSPCFIWSTRSPISSFSEWITVSRFWSSPINFLMSVSRCSNSPFNFCTTTSLLFAWVFT